MAWAAVVREKENQKRRSVYRENVRINSQGRSKIHGLVTKHAISLTNTS